MQEFFSVLLTVFLKNVMLNNRKKQKGWKKWKTPQPFTSLKTITVNVF